jgi:hypothetical protein
MKPLSEPLLGELWLSMAKAAWETHEEGAHWPEWDEIDRQSQAQAIAEIKAATTVLLKNMIPTLPPGCRGQVLVFAREGLLLEV